MPLIWTEIKKFSSLAEPILEYHASKYYSAPASIDSAVLDQIKKRLEKTTTASYVQDAANGIERWIFCRRAKKVSLGHFATKIPDKMSESLQDLIPLRDHFMLNRTGWMEQSACIIHHRSHQPCYAKFELQYLGLYHIQRAP